MADNTKIEWTDATWTPVKGCTRKSPGCVNCYAEIMAARFSQPGQWGEALASIVDTPKGKDHRWTGNVRFDEAELLKPLRWKKPRRIFVCSTSDLFHESVPDEWIDRVFAVMALCPQHTFQVLTKRADRMRDYLQARDGMGKAEICRAINMIPAKMGNRRGALSMPLPNVWLGVSVEDQARADERIPALIATPAAVRWLSCEPLQGPLDLCKVYATKDLDGVYLHDAPILDLDWIVAGGESGPGARPMHPDWARSLRDQCQLAGVPFFFKQWGNWLPGEVYTETVDGTTHGGLSRFPDSPIPGETYPGKLSHWWEGSDSFTPGPISVQIGKKAAGRLLDGREWNEVPTA